MSLPNFDISYGLVLVIKPYVFLNGFWKYAPENLEAVSCAHAASWVIASVGITCKAVFGAIKVLGDVFFSATYRGTLAIVFREVQ